MKTNTAWVSESERAHGANWREWLGHLKGTPAVGIELGSFMGESAEWMLSNIFTHPNSRYVCVDTFQGSDEHRIAGIDCSTIEADCRERLAQFGSRVEIECAFSHDALLQRTQYMGQFDVVYVDAAHDAQNVLRDAVLAYEVLKVGGVMIFDDYQWAVFSDPTLCPKMAVDAFISCYGRQLEVIGMGAQVAVRKIA